MEFQEQSVQSADEENIPSSLLISATYNSQQKKAVLKFYEPKSGKIFLWNDKTGHKPYCYSKLSVEELDFLSERQDVIEIKQVTKRDMLQDKFVQVSKIIVEDPLAIGGTQTTNSIRNEIETWESDIKYYENYLYDNKLIVGKYYKIVNGEIIPTDFEISEETKLELKSLLWDRLSNSGMADTKEFQEAISDWAELLNQPVPKIKRLSLDIEVESEVGRIPDPKLAEKRVTAVGFEGSDNLKKIFVLRRDGIQEGENELDDGIELKFYENEKEMIEDTFNLVEQYPVLLTYNGDGFDLPYLYNRANRVGVSKQKNPLYMMRDSATLQKGVHLDLYRTFSNRAFQIYAFGQKYTDFSLNSVCKGILNEEKIGHEMEIDEMTYYQIAKYCQNDARLTYKLTSFNDDLLMNLLVVITRIARMPIDDIARMGVSQWIRSQM